MVKLLFLSFTSSSSRYLLRMFSLLKRCQEQGGGVQTWVVVVIIAVLCFVFFVLVVLSVLLMNPFAPNDEEELDIESQQVFHLLRIFS